MLVYIEFDVVKCEYMSRDYLIKYMLVYNEFDVVKYEYMSREGEGHTEDPLSKLASERKELLRVSLV